MLANYQRALRLFSRDVWLFLAVNVLIGFTYFGIYALLLNLYLLRLGYDSAFIGLVNAAGPLALAIWSLPAGVLSQRWGSRKSLLIGFSLIPLGFGLLPFVEFLPSALHTGWLLASYALAWFGGTFFQVNASPFLMSATTETERQHAFSMQIAVIRLAGFTGNLLGGLLPGWFALLLHTPLAQPAPYRYALWIAAVLLLPAVLLIGATRPARVDQAQAPVTATDAAPYGLILMLTLIMLLRTGGEWVMRIFFNVYLDAGLHVSTALIGALGAAGQLLGIAALAGPLVMMRWGPVRAIGWGTVGMACAFLPLILLPHWTGVGLGFMSMITLTSLTAPAFTVLSQESVAPRWRTTIAGAQSLAFGASIAAMAFGGGYLIGTVGYRILFLVAAGLTLVGALLFFVYFPRRRKVLAHLPAPDMAS
ncbi:MAG: MFS transporter [Caldilinea sp. CFX5]|nr:MFS transporter [Caldilinea sp. CFX5]